MQFTQEAIKVVENNGIVFLDEIDKICVREGRAGADVSREGVQRDLLPLIEGTTVATKHGSVKTDHILFIASGAFHISKPSDLLPELQGRLPIRVELKPLTRDDMRRILTEPEASLIKQYIALMATEGLTLEFSEDAIDAVADIAVAVNSSVENIGARRLQTVMERVLDDVSFGAPDRSGETVKIDAAYVHKHVGDLAKNTRSEPVYSVTAAVAGRRRTRNVVFAFCGSRLMSRIAAIHFSTWAIICQSDVPARAAEIFIDAARGFGHDAYYSELQRADQPGIRRRRN